MHPIFHYSTLVFVSVHNVDVIAQIQMLLLNVQKGPFLNHFEMFKTL